MEHKNYKNSQYMNVFPSYLENSVLKPRPFYHTGFEDSLERIMFKEEPEPAEEEWDKLPGPRKEIMDKVKKLAKKKEI